MKFNAQFSIKGGRRHSIRLRDYDYTTHAAYFITLCAHERAPLFGAILNHVVHLSPIGELIQKLWIATPDIRLGVTLDAFVIMPNHFHAIIILPRSGRPRGQASVLARPPRSLGSLVAGYKSACTSQANALLGTTRVKIWQRNYYERVIRDERSLNQTRQYIAANPSRWVPNHNWIRHPNTPALPQ
jgi:putative transposase